MKINTFLIFSIFGFCFRFPAFSQRCSQIPVNQAMDPNAEMPYREWISQVFQRKCLFSFIVSLHAHSPRWTGSIESRLYISNTMPNSHRKKPRSRLT
ncbi:hypothetical protein IW262DRAFT_465891 [Armillaria fumosa]|nr:hypothetical protein IW262DRAFT_465891 [Armillaria fumosa]